MPIFQIKPPTHGGTVALWSITETEQELTGLLQPTPDEIEQLQTIKAPLRRLHWLAGRCLAARFLPDFKQIRYAENGKPFVEGSRWWFSIAHSASMAAFSMNNITNGIDIELITPRIRKITAKFLNDYELKQIGELHTDETLYKYWCAKEAIVKWSGDRTIDFRKQITVWMPDNHNNAGLFQASFADSGGIKEITLWYEKIENYMLVYTTN